MKEKESLTYKGSGVDYSAMDPFKILCQIAGIETAKAFANSGSNRNTHIQEHKESRGESVYLQMLQMLDDFFIAHVHEGLGTKNLVADAMLKLTGKTYYGSISQDTVAMGVNDMITGGALPSSIAMHLSVGHSDWFNNEQRVNDLVEGWKNACIIAGAIWGCGETPTLKDVILPGVAELSVSVLGIVLDGEKLFETKKIESGDVILFIESSGIHANGLTLARKIAERKDSFFRKIKNFFFPKKFPLRALPQGYLTPICEGGPTYGEALLEPTIIYVPYIERWLSARMDIHYAVNITGHGWRKLMRAPQPFHYVIDTLPSQNPIFDFVQEKGNVTDTEMYGNYNMGAGFAVFVSKQTAQDILEYECKRNELLSGNYDNNERRVFVAGHIKKSDTKKVTIRPKNIVFESVTLAVR